MDRFDDPVNTAAHKTRRGYYFLDFMIVEEVLLRHHFGVLFVMGVVTRDGAKRKGSCSCCIASNRTKNGFVCGKDFLILTPSGT